MTLRRLQQMRENAGALSDFDAEYYRDSYEDPELDAMLDALEDARLQLLRWRRR